MVRIGAVGSWVSFCFGGEWVYGQVKKIVNMLGEEYCEIESQSGSRYSVPRNALRRG